MEPFDDDIEQLLALERARPDIGPEHARALRDAAAQRLALDTQPLPESAPAAGAAAGISASKAAVWSVAIFVAGLGTGVALTRWLMRDDGSAASSAPDAGVPDPGASVELPLDTAPQQTRLPLGAQEVPAADEAEPAPATPGSTRAPAAPPSPRSPRAGAAAVTGGEAAVGEGPSAATVGDPGADPGAATRDGALNAERLLVEAAQSALARGQAAAALRYASEHAERYPAGRLAAEREALAIRALLRLRRVTAARDRAEAFDARWPGSLLRGSFAAALERALAEPGTE